MKRAGFDSPALEAEIATNPTTFDAIIQKHEREQRDAGHWGVPLFVFEGEPFFGHDRIDHLAWRIRER